MNDELKAALVGLIKDLQSAKDFAIEQAPDVVRQMVMFESIWAWCSVAFCAIGLLLGVLSVRWGTRKMGEGEWDIEAPMAAQIGGCVFGLFCVIGGGVNLYTAVMATWAPKWFVVQKIMELVR